ncbi:hypothetical protein [Roseisalinus antarcticus]|uniref:Bacterial SH3 domain protein n=1 Tax=Roseisalinus antarcticus TaxID=254357 RepID=A0A1Y5U1Y3_9RHOB|nr:hypothetical protein [Roseisalinus antarcticus]SLN75071.1 hypothetical protein ROA7023_03887 [Roseisalinus antarcticus]
MSSRHPDPAEPADIEPAIPAIEQVRIVTSGSGLNHRRWPSFNDNILGTIPDRTIVPVQRRGVVGGMPWLCVAQHGREGWVVAAYTQTVS